MPGPTPESGITPHARAIAPHQRKIGDRAIHDTVARPDRGRVGAATRALEKAHDYHRQGNLAAALTLAQGVKKFLAQIRAEPNFSRAFGHMDGLARSTIETAVGYASAAVNRIEGGLRNSSPLNEAVWRQSLGLFANARQFLEVLAGDRDAAEAPQVRSLGRATTAALTAGLVIASIPFVVGGVVYMASLSTAGSAYVTSLYVSNPELTVLIAELVLGASIQFAETGRVSLDPGTILQILILRRQGGGGSYRAKARVVGRKQGGVTLLEIVEAPRPSSPKQPSAPQASKASAPKPASPPVKAGGGTPELVPGSTTTKQKALATTTPSIKTKQPPAIKAGQPTAAGPVQSARTPEVHYRARDGAIVITTEVGPGTKRKGYERLLLPSVKVGLPGWERAHSQGAGTGTEVRAGILYAHPNVNQRLQRLGVEKTIRELHRIKPAGVKLQLTTETFAHPGTRKLKEIRYRVTAVRGEERQIVFEADITQADTLKDPRVTGNASFPTL